MGNSQQNQQLQQIQDNRQVYNQILTQNQNYQPSTQELQGMPFEFSQQYHDFPFYAQVVPGITLSEIYQSSLSIDKNSVVLKQHSQLKQLYSLQFTFNSLLDCTVNIYLMAKEIFTCQDWFQIKENNLQPLGFQFKRGMNKKFSMQLMQLDISQYTQEQLAESQDQDWPLIIEIRSNQKQINTVDVIINYCVFQMQLNGEIKIIVNHQKVNMNDKWFLTNEIYGISDHYEQSDQTQVQKECNVCFTNQKNILCLPCRHLCICEDCAKEIRIQRSPRCPICRKWVDNFLKFIAINQLNAQEISNVM